MIHTTPKTQKALQQDFDQFGDSYTLETTVEELRSVFNQMVMSHQNT